MRWHDCAWSLTIQSTFKLLSKPCERKPYATDFHSLIASFDLKRLTTTSTHKSGNKLDLIYTCDCTADNILVQPLYIIDHFFITFTLHLHYILLPGCHQPPYLLILDETYTPFLPPIQWHFMLYLDLLSRLVPVAQWLEHCVSSAKVVGSIPREHTYWQKKMYSLNAM